MKIIKITLISDLSTNLDREVNELIYQLIKNKNIEYELTKNNPENFRLPTVIIESQEGIRDVMENYSLDVIKLRISKNI